MNITIEKMTKKDRGAVKRLYLSAFPRNERPPFYLLESRAKKGLGNCHVVYDNGEFIGFAYVIPHLDMAYLYYFAIDGEKRGMGYGSAVLSELKRIYDGKRFFLARETLDEKSDNYAQRVKRHEFYLKNGLEDLSVKIKEASVTFDAMGIGGTVKPEEYDAMMTAFCGKIIKRLMDMRLFEE